MLIWTPCHICGQPASATDHDNGCPNKPARVLQLARDMAGYGHHAGYPVYDGGHTEPEESCQHPDCVAVREASTAEDPTTLGAIIRRALPTANLQILNECICLIQQSRQRGQVRVTFMAPDENIQPADVVVDPMRARNIGVVIWVPQEIYRGH